MGAIKELITELADRGSKQSTFMQATAVYVYFLNDKLKVTSSSALADFTAIEDYPDTEASLKVAASVRATITGITNIPDQPGDWQNYFWNRGRSLGQCE